MELSCQSYDGARREGESESRRPEEGFVKRGNGERENPSWIENSSEIYSEKQRSPWPGLDELGIISVTSKIRGVFVLMQTKTKVLGVTMVHFVICNHFVISQ